jgi:hypothetical protein
MEAIMILYLSVISGSYTIGLGIILLYGIDAILKQGR